LPEIKVTEVSDNIVADIYLKLLAFIDIVVGYGS